MQAKLIVRDSGFWVKGREWGGGRRNAVVEDVLDLVWSGGYVAVCNDQNSTKRTFTMCA